MRKVIKTSLLIIFIIFVLGITTSNAFTVVTDDESEKIIIEDEQNISEKYCIQRSIEDLPGAKYRFEDVINYPGNDSMGHAKAYAYAALKRGFSHDQVQEAIWYILGQSDPNDLGNLAMAYQNYKNSEKKLTITEEPNAKTFFNENRIIYGPFKIEYSYASKSSGSLSDSWGGFSYALVNEKGNNVSSTAKLCTLENGEYKEIKSTEITSNEQMNGYYTVNTGEYSKRDLYIVTIDKTTTKVYLKLRENIVEYKARVEQKKGGTAVCSSGKWYCSDCIRKFKSQGGFLYQGDWWKETSRVSTELPPISGTYHDTESKSADGSTMVRVSYKLKSKEIDTKPAIYHTWEVLHNYGNGDILWRCSRYEHKERSSTKPVWTVCVKAQTVIWKKYERTIASYKKLTSTCSNQLTTEKGNHCKCGWYNDGGVCNSQNVEVLAYISKTQGYEKEMQTEIELGTTIELTKEWLDYDNQYGLKPENIKFNVYRSTDKENWEKLTENNDYIIVEESKEQNTWKILITGLIRVDSKGRNYYFKVEEQEQHYYDPTYVGGSIIDFKDNPAYGKLTIENKLKHVSIGGYVWLDGQTGIKPAIPNNGIMDASETKMANIVVHLYKEQPNTQGGKPLTQAGQKVLVDTTVTDQNGHYEFKDKEIGVYYVEFDYDGIHYEDTIKVAGGSSKAFEDISNGLSNTNRRNVFNSRFQTITYKKSNDGTTLNYKYENKKSTLITNEEGKTTIKPEFKMTAETPQEFIKVDTGDINLGLVKRGTDIALSTDVYDAKVTINGQATDYTYNKENNSIEIGQEETQEKVKYNLNLYASDYSYRIRDYVNTQNFQEKDYINEENSGIKTGDTLRVYVTYKLNLQNQSTKTMQINEVKYKYDEKYTFVGFESNNYAVQNTGNMLTIDLNKLTLKEGETQTLYLIFEVRKADNTVLLGDFQNKAEITSYSNNEGLIDEDSQPGNFVNNNQIEDDSDTAGGLTIKVPENQTRKITGNVFDKTGAKVNDVIVQLIELKTVNGKIYEYIWEETVSGTDKGIRLNADGTALETYSYNKAEGYYEFQGFIPGDYIVRFIYGDGTTYDMTENVIKYNGQDYKSMVDPNYKAEWYNTSSYTKGATVARDNEARRLETMAYAANIDAEKGLLLKLLDNKELNETEKEVLITTYNKLYDPDITTVTQEAINKLLKEEVLQNTWMCAETSKIKIAVDVNATDFGNTTTQTTVDGQIEKYKNTIEDINLGLEQRPVTKIELKKYITGFKLTTSSGQTLVNATVDINEYLTEEYAQNPSYINNKVQGIKDNVTILNTVWQYEVAPTEINTIVDGANLEFEYTLVVKNTGDTDYLSTELANAYKNSDIETYKTTLANKAKDIKKYIRNGSYNTQIGNNLGNSYYAGGNGQAKVLTEVTNIRDYINNDLTFVPSGKVAIDETAPKTHRILRDDYSMQETTINTILKTTEGTGKLENTGNAVMYKVILGKNPISSTGTLNFENYIAEVMSYTNAAGRRALTSTPGNAEIIDHERREGKTHEIDEADTGRIQIGVATGNDETTNYVIIIAVAVGIALVAIGAYVVKKYFLK